MERRASSSGDLRSSGRASQRFSEVVSQGPTAIPAREDVDAAISSVLAVEDLGFGGRPLQQRHGGAQLSVSRGNDSTSNGFSAHGSRGLSTGGPAANNPSRSAGADTLNPSPFGMGGGEGGSGGVPDGGGGGVGGGGGSGVVGGVINWALWPLWGTIDALKWAGGTVNEVAVAPVIRMASPWGLAGSMLTTVKAFTPQRARDLARVAGNLGLNAAGLARTPAGGELLRSTGRATGSLSVAVSSPAGRQFLLESATGLVKLAEALDTPEAKNFIKQGAVVAARGMDALASRHSKIFVKDLADVVVRLVELANSHEATTMAAEFTVNVAHALEMEHMAGLNRRAAAKSSTTDETAADADESLGSGAEAACSASAGGGGGAGHFPSQRPSGGAEDVAVPDGNPEGGGSSAGAVCGGTEQEQEERTLDDLVREARLQRARQECVGGVGSGGGGSAEGSASADRRRSESARSSMRVLDGGNGKGDPSGEDQNSEGPGERAHFDRDPQRVNLMPIIRQADLKGDTPLSTFRRAGTAAAVSPTTPRSDGTAGTADGAGNAASAFRSPSPPPSPRGRHNSLPAAASAAAADPALAALDGSLSPEAAPRGRASTLTGAGSGASGGGEGVGFNHTAAAASSSDAAADAEARARLGAGVGRRGVGAGVAGVDSDGVESVVSGARPAVEYERDGNAKLPRFKSAHIANVLRGQPLGLELQLEAPNEDSLDDTVARASRLSMEGTASPCSPRVSLAGGSGFGATQQARPEATDGSQGGEAAAPDDPGSSAAAARARGSWKQLVFAWLLLLFAADGLRHRWKSTFRSESAAAAAASRMKPSSKIPAPSSTAPRQEPFGRYQAGGDEDGGGGLGGMHTFGTAFLPPTCQDPVSGRTMAVWATPAGPCLAPVSTPGGENGGAGGGRGGGGPGCAASFRLCTAAEVVVRDSGDSYEYPDDGGPERDEL